jgi:hypothetical protein
MYSRFPGLLKRTNREKMHVCKHRHEKEHVCSNWVSGFCPQGPSCIYAHPKGIVDPLQSNLTSLVNAQPQENYSDFDTLSNSKG